MAMEAMVVEGKMKTFISGFKFGMMLQFAIGPITLLIFQIAVSEGFFAGIQGMIGAGIADALFVAAAILGLGAILNRRRDLQRYMKSFGGFVMLGFGILMISSSLAVNLVPEQKLVNGDSIDSIIMKVFILTMANPMTVLFWTGVFAGKIAEQNMHIRDLWIFGIGAVMTTVFFQSLVAGAGSLLQVFLGPAIMLLLNILVGIMLIKFGVGLFLDKKDNELASG